MHSIFPECSLLLAPSTGYPNCLQTTLASRLSQELSQMVPQNPLRQISTVPCLWPPRSLIWPSVQLVGTGVTTELIKNDLRLLSTDRKIVMFLNVPIFVCSDKVAGTVIPHQHKIPEHLTPASSLCLQLWTPISWREQLRREDSVPLHLKLSRKIPPLPLPK